MSKNEEYLKLGSFVKDKSNDWHLVTRIMGDPELFFATGLGKNGSYPMRKSKIIDSFIPPDKTLLEKILGDKVTLWCDKNFKTMYVITPPKFKVYEAMMPDYYYELIEVVRRMDGKLTLGDDNYIGFPYQISNYELVKLKEFKVTSFKDILKEAKIILENIEELKKKAIKKVRFFPEDMVTYKQEVYFGDEYYYELN